MTSKVHTLENEIQVGIEYFTEIQDVIDQKERQHMFHYAWCIQGNFIGLNLLLSLKNSFDF